MIFGLRITTIQKNKNTENCQPQSSAEADILISWPYLRIFSESRPNIEVSWTCFLCMIVDAYFIDFAAGAVIAKLELHEMCAYTP